jgi:exodeoxyribonuclease-3
VKLATWNVNSIRQRLPHVLDWLNANEPDVLALQEIKTEADKFPLAEIEASGYRCVLSGQKAYNGVALISRDAAADVIVDIPDFADEQRRVIAASYGDTRVINVYVPNGQSVGSDKYRYKLDWLDALHGWLEGELKKYPRLAIVGDFNIAPEDRDVHDPELWRDQVLCSGPERERLAALLKLGLVDTFRLSEQSEKSFSWWDYREMGFRRNRGLRIDLILASRALAEDCSATIIDTRPRKLEKPSDHAPVLAVFRAEGPSGMTRRLARQDGGHLHPRQRRPRPGFRAARTRPTSAVIVPLAGPGTTDLIASNTSQFPHCCPWRARSPDHLGFSGRHTPDLCVLAVAEADLDLLAEGIKGDHGAGRKCPYRKLSVGGIVVAQVRAVQRQADNAHTLYRSNPGLQLGADRRPRRRLVEGRHILHPVVFLNPPVNRRNDPGEVVIEEHHRVVVRIHELGRAATETRHRARCRTVDGRGWHLRRCRRDTPGGWYVLGQGFRSRPGAAGCRGVVPCRCRQRPARASKRQ